MKKPLRKGPAGSVAYTQTDTCVFTQADRLNIKQTDRRSGRQAGQKLPVCLTGAANGNQTGWNNYKAMRNKQLRQSPALAGTVTNPS